MVKEANEEQILKWLVKYDSNMILFHHRRPTSTVNVKRAAHPFSTKDYFGDNQYILVHNGHVSNAYELQEEHEKLGIQYQSILQDGTFNDSEALAWDFALTIEGKQDELEAYGGIAFICLKLHKGKPERLYFGRNHNPLNLKRDKNSISLSSEGEGEMIEPQVLYNYHYASNRLTNRRFAIPSYTYTNSYSGSAYNSQYDKWYNDDYDDSDLVWDYQNHCYVPRSESTQTTLITDKDDDGEDYVLDMYGPTELETIDRANMYLSWASGLFSAAYDMAELDYEELMENDTIDFETGMRRQLLLESVLQYLISHEENVSQSSISSEWRAREARKWLKGNW